jgi:drug/metabolite transporter (DMT)-like permease
MTTPLSSILLVLLGSFVGSFGAVLLKLGSERMGKSVSKLLTNYWLASGIVVYLVSSVFYMMGIAQGELMVLCPIGAMAYIWTMIWARLFFKEAFTAGKITGMALIVVGVALINRGN